MVGREGERRGRAVWVAEERDGDGKGWGMFIQRDGG